jgi:hypothetical protein
MLINTLSTLRTPPAETKNTKIAGQSHLDSSLEGLAQDKFLASGPDSPFQRGYQEARSQFRSWHEKIPGSILEKVKVPNKADKDLTVDILTLPAQEKAENVLVISSGVHGAEGPPGSALQELFLKEFLPELDRSKTSVVFVHAVNPWGFENNHRYTENNVDLNRNSVKNVDTFDDYPNELYGNVQKLMTASKPARWYALTQAKLGFGLVKSLLQNRFDRGKVTQSVAGGQNIDPRGVNYASTKHESQIPAIRDILSGHIGEAKRVVHYDIHTGLGSRGHLHMIDNSDPPAEQASKDFMTPLTDDPDDTIWYNSSSDPGFYDVSLGDFTNVSEVAASPEATVLSYTAEVGTLGKGLLQQIDSAARYHERNSLGFFADQISEGKKQAVLDRCTEMYNPTDDLWREQATDNFRQLFRHTVRSFS